MKITYYGHSCLFVEGGGKQVIIDPFLSGNPASGVSARDIKADAVILTHGHDDHFGDTLEIAIRNKCPVIAVYELGMFCRSKGANAHTMNIGGAYDFGGFRVKLTPAFHSSSVQDGERLVYAGLAAGIILTMDGKSLYHSGDTCLFSDMKLIGERHRIDVAALPIGDNFTMGPDDAVAAAEWIGAKTVIPIHYNTFPVIRQDPAAFAAALAAKGIACAPLRSGESFSL